MGDWLDVRAELPAGRAAIFFKAEERRIMLRICGTSLLPVLSTIRILQRCSWFISLD
jgi:hypothetical protein